MSTHVSSFDFAIVLTFSWMLQMEVILDFYFYPFNILYSFYERNDNYILIH